MTWGKKATREDNIAKIFKRRWMHDKSSIVILRSVISNWPEGKKLNTLQRKFLLAAITTKEESLALLMEIASSKGLLE